MLCCLTEVICNTHPLLGKFNLPSEEELSFKEELDVGGDEFLQNLL